MSDTARGPESWESRGTRWRFHRFPASRGTGARVLHLGRDCGVWDKAAAIRFRRPGRTSLNAPFRPEAAVLERIRLELEAVPKLERKFTIERADPAGEGHAIVEKTIHVSRR